MAALARGACTSRRPTAGLAWLLLALCLVACGHAGGAGGILGSHGTGVGYVDMDALIAAHPLHAQLQAMQDQIDVLQQEASLVPTGMSPQQSAAYDQMQAELAAQSAKFQQDLGSRRTYYERREADAISRLQASTLGTDATSGGVLGGLQQQYGAQAQAMQKQAFTTFNNYRLELFRQDSDHLKHVQALIAADMRTKLAQRESELSSAETKYQVDLVRSDQEERLNLQAKLQDLALSDKDRKQYQDELSAMDAREQSKINAVKARDNAQLAVIERDLNAQAAAKYDAERKSTQAATQAKLVARQKEMQVAMTPQMQKLSGKFQQQLADVNARLAANEKYKAQAQSIHDQIASAYNDEASRSEASYRQVRAGLIARYSAIAHMQFQDNESISAQADKLASDRRDLYQKIGVQVQAQVQQIAQQDGVGIVFDSIRGAGTAIDLTDQVRKAVNSLAGSSSSPAAPTPGGS
jgi:hypothetical protein